MNIDEVLAKEEKQIFDRKSIGIAPKALAVTLCAFANADGGTVAVGITDKTRTVQGVDYETKRLNDILCAPVDFCDPTIPVTPEYVPCIDEKGRENHVLLMHVEASPKMHANQADEVYVRVGDKNKKLNFQDRLNLMYSKGLRYFEDEPATDADLTDIDLRFVEEYLQHIHYGKGAEEYLRQNKSFITEKNGVAYISNAAILLFGKDPQKFFPRATIRFIKYDGIEAKVGREMNVVKDVTFTGRILDQVRKAIDYIQIQMKEKTYLGSNGVFVEEPEYSEFVRTEIVVNAACHRDYSIRGTDIQIKMFDDRLEVDSPGAFAGLVTKENIRYTHFSRNPKIAAFLKDYDYVKEFGEGVDRMCREMESAGLPLPAFDDSTFIMKTTVPSGELKKSAIGGENPEVGGQNPAIGGENPAIGDENPAIGDGRISLDAIRERCEKQNYTGSTKNHIESIYAEMTRSRIFSSSDIAKHLGCADSTARELMRKLREIDSLQIVRGKGKGKYRFKYYTEE